MLMGSISDEQVRGAKENLEIDIYLMNGIEMEYENSEILIWWKIHSTKFPILSKFTRHMFGIANFQNCLRIDI